MKIIPAPALAALQNGTAIVTGSVRFGTPTPVRVWGGHGNQTIDGEVYLGLGQAGLIQTTAGSVGIAAEGLTLELSGIPPENMAQINTALLRGVSCVVRRLIFDVNGTTLLADNVHVRGTVDHVTRAIQAGGKAVISIDVEGSARGLGRRSGRMRSDPDQRLILATDGGMKHISYAGDRTLYWGGKPPERARNTLPNVGRTISETGYTVNGNAVLTV